MLLAGQLSADFLTLWVWAHCVQGLCTLQHIDCIIGDVVFKCGKQARNRVVRLLELKKSSLETIIGTLYEFVDNLDDDVNSRNRKEHILDTIVVLRDSVQS
eukprot:m.164409 g.164409  ORF g.164409 m.164409 type:complete len:101 (+) comp18111_c0_seq81:3075-3377(+)